MTAERRHPGDADRLAHASLAAGDPTGWFERLYAEAGRGTAVVPWDRGAPHPLLVDWARRAPAEVVRGTGRRALVVGAGYGSDAAFLAGLGFAVTGFDLAPTAVAAARERFPDPAVTFVVADLLDLPAEWAGAYDLVLECFTVQALPPALRVRATAAVAECVAPGGRLVVVAAGRADDLDPTGPPWPLTRAEVEAFAQQGLELARLEQLWPHPDRLRWRAELIRSAG